MFGSAKMRFRLFTFVSTLSFESLVALAVFVSVTFPCVALSLAALKRHKKPFITPGCLNFQKRNYQSPRHQPLAIIIAVIQSLVRYGEPGGTVLHVHHRTPVTRATASTNTTTATGILAAAHRATHVLGAGARLRCLLARGRLRLARARLFALGRLVRIRWWVRATARRRFVVQIG